MSDLLLDIRRIVITGDLNVIEEAVGAALNAGFSAEKIRKECRIPAMDEVASLGQGSELIGCLAEKWGIDTDGGHERNLCGNGRMVRVEKGSVYDSRRWVGEGWVGERVASGSRHIQGRA